MDRTITDIVNEMCKSYEERLRARDARIEYLENKLKENNND